MALIKQWLPGFLERHRRRYGPHDWPEAGSEDDRDFARIWFQAFYDARVTEPEADTASVRLGPSPPRWRNDHLPAVLAEVRALRQANAAAGAVPDDRATAERQSRGCGVCGGGGFAPIYHPLYAGDRFTRVRDHNDRMVTVPARVVTQCICPLGRWMRSKIRDTETLDRLPDYELVRAGGHAWLPHPPGEGPATGVPDAAGPGWRDVRRMQGQVVQAVGAGPSAEEQRRREHRREAVPF